MKKLKAFFERLRRLWQLSVDYDMNRDRDHYKLHSRVNGLEDLVREHTVVHADVHFMGACQIIVIGQYRERDYVRLFNVDVSSFHELVEMLRRIERNAQVGRFDMVGHGPPFSVLYDRDRF